MYTGLLTVRIDGLDINLRYLSNEILGFHILNLLNCSQFNYYINLLLVASDLLNNLENK